jgi:3-deoxy-D-manno-octulosonate 8-phosphate phosphatase (KDO 8-P phosphatase)
LSKLEPYQEVLRDSGIPEDQIAYVGDDFSDAVLMLRVGLPIAVANARPEIKKIARYVTSQPGGRGAMREVVELILRAQGHWDAVLAKWGLRKQ